jgi:peroxiredoxin
MYYRNIFLTAIFIIFAGFTGPALADPVIGEAAALFEGISADGDKVRLDQFRGKTVVLEWTNHECPFVVKHYQSHNIPNLQKEAAAQGVAWVQIISSAPGKEGHVDGNTARRLNAARGAAPAYTVLDENGTIGKQYGATNTPHFFIIDKDGILVYKGGIDSIASADQADIAKADNYVRAALADLTAGKKVAKSSTRPYGCTVKYAG